MKSEKPFGTVYVLSLLFVMAGAVFKIMNWPLASTLLLIGLLLTFAFVVMGLWDVLRDDSKPATEKVIWFIGFLLFSSVTGIIYYFAELRPRRRRTHLM